MDYMQLIELCNWLFLLLIGLINYKILIHNKANLTEFGNDNLVSMLNKVVGAFNSEYEIDSVNRRIIIKRRIGVDTDYQIRYKNNIQNISRQINSENVKNSGSSFFMI